MLVKTERLFFLPQGEIISFLSYNLENLFVNVTYDIV